MSLTVGEVLENAEYNKKGKLGIQILLAEQQEENYNIAKQLGAEDEDDWYDWEDKVEEYKLLN